MNTQLTYDNLDSHQKQAYDMVMKNDFSIITGSGGSGKSYTINVITQALRAQGFEVSKLAPTGRAAKKINGTTIHRWLEPDVTEDTWGNVKIKGFNKIMLSTKEAIIIDEASMIGNELWAKVYEIFVNDNIIKSPDKKIVLVGDPYQLPPIGSGTPFIDFIKNKTYPHTHLQSIHRQSQDNDLIEFSNLVKDNIALPNDKVWNNVHVMDMDTVLNKFKAGERPQLIAPKNVGENGVISTNKFIQKVVPNLGKKLFDSLEWDDSIKKFTPNYEIKENDKIVITANNYKENVTNGTIGTIKGIVWKQKTFMTKFGMRTDIVECAEIIEEVTNTELYIELRWLKKKIALAYCITVHKAQGSEWDDIYFMACGEQATDDTKMIYTAITRAKHHAYIILTPLKEEVKSPALWDVPWDDDLDL